MTRMTMTTSKIDNARGPNFKVKALVNEQADIAFCTFEKAKSKYHQDIRQFGSDSAVLMEMQGYTSSSIIRSKPLVVFAFLSCMSLVIMFWGMS